MWCCSLPAALMLLLISGTSAYGDHNLKPPVCPEGCYCPNVLHTNCSSGLWQNLPLGLNPHLRILNMSNNNLQKLEKEMFLITKLPYLNVMYLQRNKISNIQKQTFITLDSLRFLYLDKNQIRNLYTGIFNDSPHLEVLSLTHNPLKFPNRGPFLQSDTLRILDISYCNISFLPKESFVSLPILEELRISYNFLSDLDDELFMGLQSLKYLYLSNNNLSYLRKGLFIYSELLNVLDLSSNKLQDLDGFVFNGLNYLQVLYLQHNNLSAINEDIFSSLGNLTELHLQNNNIQTVESNLFKSNNNLKKLFLDNNAIINVSRDALSSLVAVSHLYISNNHLRTFHMRLVCEMQSLQFLRVFGNQLPCDCELKSLWEWALKQGMQIWASCLSEVVEPPFIPKTISNNSVTRELIHLTCNKTTCLPEEIIEEEDAFLLLVYILSGICPLVLVIICSVITVCAFKNHRKNMQEREISYNMTTSSTGYLMQEHVPSGQIYSSDEQQNVDNCGYAMQPTPVKEHAHVSPYSVSPVLYDKEDSASSQGPPPIPAMPPKELLLTNSPYAVPLGYIQEPVPVRGRAFSTSEEEESRPLMRPHQQGTLPATSRSSSFRLRQTARRMRPRQQLGNLSSDTEPWSSYSEDASDTVSVTQCEMANWSGSEASTHVISENNGDTAHTIA